jgi:hypothetical protein
VGTPDIQIGTSLLPEQDSHAQYVLMSEWLRVCRETNKHGHRAESAQGASLFDVPTRVLDVGDAYSPHIRLINGEDMASRQYVALIHTCGSGPLHGAIRSNLASLCEAIDFVALPRNFQDAVLASRGLKVRYLRIHILCVN